jgi:hypothetical protein
MANHLSHDALRTPVRGAKFNVRIPFDNQDDAAEVFDTEISKDNGAFADCTNELEVIGGGTSCDMGYITLTAAEMTAYSIVLKLNAVAGNQPTLIDFEPANLPALYSGTMTAGSTTQCTLQAGNRPDFDYALAGCIIRNNTTGEAREILTYNGTTGVATFATAETAFANTHTYDVLLPEQSALDYWRNVLSGSGVDQILSHVTTNLPDVLSLAAIDTVVDTALANAGVTAVVMGRLDVAISTRMATFTPMTQADVRTALGMASANLDTQLADIPTVAEFNARTIVAANYALEATLTAIKGATFNGATDSLEAIRDRGDAAWTTGSGGLDAAGIRTALGMATDNLDAQLADLPTVAEFNARTLASAAYATEANVNAVGATVAALPSDADVNAQCDQALADWGKTGFKLASDGLDVVVCPAYTGLATTFITKTDQVWRKFFKKTVAENVTNTIKTFEDDGITAQTTQTFTETATVQTINAAS